MKRNTLKTIVFTMLAGLTLTGAVNRSQAQQYTNIITQPQDQLVYAGSPATFSVTTGDSCLYQWMSNGVAIDGQTNNSFIITNATSDDAGLYACNITNGNETATTREAVLEVYTSVDVDGVDPITVFSFPTVGSGGIVDTCPGPYVGYVNFTQPSPQWGWSPATNTTVFTAADGGGRTDTIISYVGEYGDTGCDQTSVTIPNPPTSPLYQFTIYFPTNPPTTNYPIILTGLNP